MIVDKIQTTEVEGLMEQAAANGHRMGAWHWVDETTAQSRCIYCMAGIVVGGGIDTLGLSQACLFAVAQKYQLVATNYHGGPITYD